MNSLSTVFHFYLDGFRQMTLGRTLWAIILLKLFIMFAILRLFFFRPAMQGMTDEQKQEHVATRLARPAIPPESPESGISGITESPESGIPK